MQLLRVKEVAQMLKLHPGTIYKLAEYEGLPHYKCGKSVRFSLEEVVAWLKTRRQAGKNPRSPE